MIEKRIKTFWQVSIALVCSLLKLNLVKVLLFIICFYRFVVNKDFRYTSLCFALLPLSTENISPTLYSKKNNYFQ